MTLTSSFMIMPSLLKQMVYTLLLGRRLDRESAAIRQHLRFDLHPKEKQALHFCAFVNPEANEPTKKVFDHIDVTFDREKIAFDGLRFRYRLRDDI